MRNIIIILSLAFSLTGCYQQENERLKSQIEVLKTEKKVLEVKLKEQSIKHHIAIQEVKTECSKEKLILINRYNTDMQWAADMIKLIGAANN